MKHKVMCSDSLECNVDVIALSASVLTNRLPERPQSKSANLGQRKFLHTLARQSRQQPQSVLLRAELRKAGNWSGLRCSALQHWRVNRAGGNKGSRVAECGNQRQRLAV